MVCCSGRNHCDLMKSITINNFYYYTRNEHFHDGFVRKKRVTGCGPDRGVAGPRGCPNMASSNLTTTTRTRTFKNNTSTTRTRTSKSTTTTTARTRTTKSITITARTSASKSAIITAARTCASKNNTTKAIAASTSLSIVICDRMRERYSLSVYL